MVQMENSKFFEKDVDVVENIVPICPNCHRKIHNADKNTIIKMLNLYYNNSDKRELIRKGIFVDIETLARFYGIEGD
jgi:5-methylcytosine-specific restriction protein A